MLKMEVVREMVSFYSDSESSEHNWAQWSIIRAQWSITRAQLWHNRENFGALLKSMIGNLKSIIDTGLYYINIFIMLF